MAFDSEVLQCARTLFEHRFEAEIRPAHNIRLWETKTKFSVGAHLPFSGMDAQRLIGVEVQFAKEAATAQAECLVAAIRMAGLKFDNEALIIGLNNTKELLDKHKYSATNTVFSAFAQQIDPAVKAGIEQDLDAKLARIHDSILSLLKSKLAEAILLAKAETNTSGDKVFARLAIDEARKSVSENDGRPHPKVGAVVVKDGQVLSRAYRGEVPGNHAEFVALEKKLNDEAVVGATVYTTLEPCTTRNPPKIPCVERLLGRKVARVVVGMVDPDIRISGQGIRKLVSANIEVSLFPHDLVLELEELNRDFTRFCKNKQEQREHDKQSDPWLDLFREKQRLEEEVASLQAQVPGMRVIPAMKVGMDEYDILVEKLGRKNKQVTEIEERMSRY
jgi:pyrimidine deaminase RibD-like protein